MYLEIVLHCKICNEMLEFRKQYFLHFLLFFIILIRHERKPRLKMNKKYQIFITIDLKIAMDLYAVHLSVRKTYFFVVAI